MEQRRKKPQSEQPADGAVHPEHSPLTARDRVEARRREKEAAAESAKPARPRPPRPRAAPPAAPGDAPRPTRARAPKAADESTKAVAESTKPAAPRTRKGGDHAVAVSAPPRGGDHATPAAGAAPKPARPRKAAEAATPKLRSQPLGARPGPRRRPAAAEAATPGPRHTLAEWVASGHVASAALLVVSLFSIVYIFTNNRFTVQNVQVDGAEVMKPADVIKQADAFEQSIWYVDTAEVVRRLKASAYIADASASVALPDTLLVDVVERRPQIRWKNGGSLFFVDASGRVLGDADPTAAVSDTLVIEDHSAQALKPNDYVDSDALSLANALALRLTPETGVQPISINWSDDKGVYVLAPDNKTIIFGTSERLDEKLVVLDRLLKDGSVFTLLDLRPQTPYYRNEG
ncbi:FtsQ-type POTRA domain-containing protein [Chloroflexia bacterium SDU3-3]|nr:FtsQ-type POTRA domain-containing protein [Chloroflexia bacterium SDU3-3]